MKYVGALVLAGIAAEVVASVTSGIGGMLVLFGVVAAAFAVKRYEKSAAMVRRSFAEIDQMDGHAFEHFVADLLKKSGFRNVRVTKASGDYGVDILANYYGERWAFQCKRYAKNCGLKPIQEVYAGAVKYGAGTAVVVTNSHFTKSAEDLARRLRVKLWDREKLCGMIERIEREESARRGTSK